ncbi:hypothetical protein BQ8482_140033 [Mesorhizobium delmotii]|uniref:Uncharacterized protein n=1 Tax=Mesorhizobium delmotii TaxID=1631247 RepID=A0A2P9AH18_9HYPH|nr:hypothetical protein BQ8482_140033 [Mesorhizobium delmotii]
MRFMPNFLPPDGEMGSTAVDAEYYKWRT